MAMAAAPALQQRAWGQQVRLPAAVRVGIVGLEGHWTEMTQPLGQLPDVSIVALATPDEKAARGALRRKGMEGARHYRDYREMLDREKLDVVALTNSNGDRADAVVAVAERKIHPVAEKPLATTWEGLARVKKAVNDSGVKLGMLLPMRFDPPYKAIKQLCESGELGEIVQVSAQKSYKLGERAEWFRDRRQYGSSVIWIGIHMVDLMRWCSGREFVRVASMESRVGHPELRDMQTVTGSIYGLDNGGLGILRMDYLRPETAKSHGDDRLRIAGQTGIAEYQTSTGVTVISTRRGQHTLTELPPKSWLFVDYLRATYLNEPPVITVPDMYRTTEIVLRSWDAAEQNKVLEL
jgi:predicted dehydrogenase